MKHFVLFCILLAQTVFIWAVEANEFLIGTFSQYQLRYAGDDYDQNFVDLAQYLHNANYNAINLQVYDNSSPDEFEYILYTESKNNNIPERYYSSASLDIGNIVMDNGKHLFSVVSLGGGQESETIVTPVMSAMIYPNPMRGNTNIEVNTTAKSVVDISIYNLKGQLVRKIDSAEILKGNTSFIWNGLADDGKPVAQGIYFCRIKSQNYLLTKKLIVLD